MRRALRVDLMINKRWKKVLGDIAVQFYRYRILYVVMVALGILSVCDIPAADSFKFSIVYRVVFSVFVAVLKTTILFALILFLFKNKYLKILGCVFIGVYAFLSLLNFFSWQFYGFGISRKLILIAVQTTPSEINGFLPQLVSNIVEFLKSPLLWIGVCGFVLLLFIVRRIKIKSFVYSILFLTLVGGCVYVQFAATHTAGRTAVLLMARIAKYGHDVMEWDKKFKELMNQKKELPYAESVSSTHRASSIIVVVGESASRSHHSCYGYSLPTTPHLDSIKDKLFLFTDVIGSSTATAGNMERILSLKSDDRTSGDGLDYPLLIDVFERAGYKTYWLSNQERTGTFSNTSGVMVSNASVVKYVGAENSEDALVSKHDEILIEELKAKLKDNAENKLIFLHLMGSHTEYKSRYPESFDYFTAEDEMKAFAGRFTEKMGATRAEYDNSIRYTDYVLSQVIQAADSEPASSVVVYFSDHGEGVYDEGRYYGRGERYVEVPFMIYANQSYINQNPDIMTLLESSMGKKISTANFVHQLLTLSGTSYFLYDPGLDALSPEFKERKRLVDEKEWKYEMP